MTTRQTSSIGLIAALAVALLGVGCSQVLGFKDPKLDDTGTPEDARSDGLPSDGMPVDGVPIDGVPIDGAPIDGPPIDSPSGPRCVPASCPFGCDTTTDMCRPGKLSVFLTNGAFVGNGFGGDVGAGAVRGGADARCLQTYTDTFPTLQCNHARVHAILTVNSADDSIALMSSKFSIPTDVEVHRGDDDVLIFNNWNDLTDNSKSPRAPVTTAPDQDADLVWSGFNSASTCKTWTSGLIGDFGVIGHTSLTVTNWLARASQPCDQFGRLLCVCWTGGE